MNNEERLIEIMADLLAEVHSMRTEFTGEIKELREEFTNEIRELRKDVQQLQKEQIIINLSIQEVRLSIVKLNDELVLVHNHEGRLVSLEKEVFKKAS